MDSVPLMSTTNYLSPAVASLLLGQCISILIAGTGVFATLLSDMKPSRNFPLLMSMCNYGLLSLFLIRKHYTHCTSISNHQNGSNEPKLSKWWYIWAAILDVEANFLVILAYNYTTVTSIMLLDCFTIPCAMVLSYVFLGCRYTKRHLLGTFVCLSGLVCIFIDDSVNFTGSGSDAVRGSNPLLGDVLCLAGAVLYASSNVLQEHLVKFHDRTDFLGNLGGFGFLLALVQCMVVDLPQMRRADFSPNVIGYIAGFVLCLFSMYVVTASFLQQSDAILFNLSLLTSDVYAVLFTYLWHGRLVSWLYFLAFALVIVGLALYHTERPPLVVGRQQQLQEEQHPEDSRVYPSVRGDRCMSTVERIARSVGLGGSRSASERTSAGGCTAGGGSQEQYNPLAQEDLFAGGGE